jgi:hypothetical protein
VAPDTIAGHKPGPGKHSNLILGSVTNEDLAPETVKTGRITDGTVAGRDLAADSVDETKVKDESIGAAELAADSVGAGDLESTAFYDVGTDHLDDPAGGPATDIALVDGAPIQVIGRCNQSSAGVVTSKLVVKSNSATMSVDSTAPGGVNDGPSVPQGGESTLASLGPTTGEHVAAGSFGIIMRAAGGSAIHPLAGTVVVSTHAQGSDCHFGFIGHG